MDFPPQMSASGSLSFFGAKMPTPFFFMAIAFFLADALFAFLPAVLFSAVIFFNVAFFSRGCSTASSAASRPVSCAATPASLLCYSVTSSNITEACQAGVSPNGQMRKPYQNRDDDRLFASKPLKVSMTVRIRVQTSHSDTRADTDTQTHTAKTDTNTLTHENALTHGDDSQTHQYALAHLHSTSARIHGKTDGCQHIDSRSCRATEVPS